MPNPWDVGTARVLAGLGYQALATTSGGLAFVLGRRDGEGAVSRERGARALGGDRRGDRPARQRRPRERLRPRPRERRGDDPRAAAAGLVGCSIEDSTSAEGEPIYPLSQAVERIAAAVEAAEALPFPFTLTARAENYLHGHSDLDDTIARLQAFDRAGAHVLYAPGLLDIEDIRTVCTSVSKPVNVLALPGSPSVEVLSAAGVRRISLGTGFIRTAQGAFLRAAREVHEHGTFGGLDGSAVSREINPFMRDR